MEFNCKSCGTPLENVNGKTTVVCDFCGLEQTLPKAEDPLKAKLFSEANADRFDSKFDIAKEKYEKLIQQYPDDNEAYWCKILCEYGIEYVDDTDSEKRLPTCHRTVRESIYDNPDYKRIISRASVEELRIYESEAKEIDRIQKEIIEIADKEEPYDIFICYKETEEVNGIKRRAADSHIAHKLYSNLTNKGYKLFFARVTLKEMAGSKYEPIIYSALNTAKIMIVISTNEENINAPWVRNEWSRFLEFMKTDDSKTLVPCIQDFEAYNLPPQLQDIQALNIKDMDFIETLTGIIDKKFGKFSYGMGQQSVYPSDRYDDNKNVISGLLSRAEKCIEDKNWAKALECAEACLNMDSECAEAYYISLLCSYKAVSAEELAMQNGILDNSNYKRAVQYASASLKVQLDNISKNFYYEKAKKYISSDLTSNETYDLVKGYLTKASGYKDADELIMKLSSIRAEQFAKKTEREKEENYNLALQFINSDLTIDETYKTARKYLERALGYKDATQLLANLPSERKKQIQYRQLIEKQQEREFEMEQKRKRAEEEKRLKEKRAIEKKRIKQESYKRFKEKLADIQIPPVLKAAIIMLIVGFGIAVVITLMFLIFRWHFDWVVAQWLLGIGGGIWYLVLHIVLLANGEDKGVYLGTIVNASLGVLILLNAIFLKQNGVLTYCLSTSVYVVGIIETIIYYTNDGEGRWFEIGSSLVMMAAACAVVLQINYWEVGQWFVVFAGGGAYIMLSVSLTKVLGNLIEDTGIIIAALFNLALIIAIIITTGCLQEYVLQVGYTSVFTVAMTICAFITGFEYGCEAATAINGVAAVCLGIAIMVEILLLPEVQIAIEQNRQNMWNNLWGDLDDLFGWLFSARSSVSGILKL